MTFDITIGNPPYNNDIYLDFIEFGHNISNKYTCMIVPAKWQAKSGIKNEKFRERLVPFMDKITVYKDSTEIFDIEEWGGICYFLLNKDTTYCKNIRFRSNKNINLNQEYEEHLENPLTLYPNKIIQIINKVKAHGLDKGIVSDNINLARCIFVDEQDYGEKDRYQDSVEIMQGETLVGYRKATELKTIENIDKWKIICSIMPGAVSQMDSQGKALGMFKMTILKPYQVPKGSFPVLKYFDTENECKSFVSYFNTKTISFLYFLGCCGTTLTYEFFRFIPNTTWDKLYCDNNVVYDNISNEVQLYSKFDFDESEIKIIESLIKSRSQNS